MYPINPLWNSGLFNFRFAPKETKVHETRAVIRSRRLRAAREIQPTLQPGMRGMKCGFRPEAAAGRRPTVPWTSQLMNSTSVPLWTILLSACASQLVRWTQP